MNDSVVSLTERLERLERANQRQRLVAAGLFLALILMVLWRTAPAQISGTMQSHPPRVIRAQRLEVVDTDGTPWAHIAATGDTVGLTLSNPKGKSGAWFGLQGDGSPLITVFDTKGKPVWNAP